MNYGIGDIGKPDPVRRSGGEVAVEQVRGDREVVTAVGGPHPPWPRHDGPDTVMAHQSFDTTAAHPAALGLQLGMDTRAAVLLDVVGCNRSRSHSVVALEKPRALGPFEGQ